jgi:hypothetical protein
VQYSNKLKVNSPSGNFLWISAETADVIISNLENGAERAAILAGVVIQTNVILAAVIGVSVTTERTSGNITNIWALESTSDLCQKKNESILIA